MHHHTQIKILDLDDVESIILQEITVAEAEKIIGGVAEAEKIIGVKNVCKECILSLFTSIVLHPSIMPAVTNKSGNQYLRQFTRVS